MMKKKILVLTDDLPWGHRSIAKAIFGYLKEHEKGENYEVVYREVKQEPSMGSDVYTFIYRYFPVYNRVVCKIFEKKVARELFENFSILNLPKLKKEVEKIDPDLIISAYFFHTHSLVKWRSRKDLKFKLWNLVTDPWTASSVVFNKGADLHFVYDEVALNLCKKYEIPAENIIKTGWWVRPEMYKKYNREKVRKELGFNDNRPVIFVGGGSLGTSSLLRLLPVLKTLKKKVGFVINTGTDKTAYALVEKYNDLLKKTKKKDIVQIKGLGWIDNMAEILTACDMVFGKAGPNFLFDVMAVERPFVAITHIGGQEDGNIELIKKKKLGWVKEKKGEIAKFLVSYLNDPKTYQEKYLNNIKKEALINKASLPMVLEMVKKI